MNFFIKVRNRAYAHLVRAALIMQSHFAYIRSLGEADKLIIDKPCNHPQKILLLALFEKGKLRADIINLLKAAKSQDIFVVCVNTSRLGSPKDYDALLDCYIERYNFGRDFGSYKAGVSHLTKRGYLIKCPRLILLNDSVFYSRKNINNFILSLCNTDIEVLGATENHEIEHHLGSFCLSLSNSVFVNNKFTQYWRKYKRSDVRPIVIKKGEMQLTKTLKKCVSGPDQLQALFDITWFTGAASNNDKFIEKVLDLCRTSDYVDWDRTSLRSVVKRLNDRYMHIVSVEPGSGPSIHFAESIDGIVRLISASVGANAEEEDLIMERARQELINDLSESFLSGSQIHQNAILLHFLGMPIVKLDGLYRGMLSIADVVTIADQLEDDEAVIFKRLAYSKPFGGHTLFGWKRLAFQRGLI